VFPIRSAEVVESRAEYVDVMERDTDVDAAEADLQEEDEDVSEVSTSYFINIFL